MSTARVAVIFGGRSSEHSISCISAAAVWEALEAAGYDVLPIAVTANSTMVHFTGRPEDLRSDDLPRIEGGSSTVMIGATADRPGAVIDGRVEAIDVVFPVLHGPWGEDGTIQGLLDFVGVPYVGSGVLASAMCMDKITAKVHLRAAGVSVAEWIAIDARADIDPALDRAMAMSAVLFIKPSRAGSSVGITRVDLETTGRDSLAQAVRAAREHDPRVIIEAGVEGAREIECGVRQTPDGAIDTSQVAEISVRDGHDFYDFAAKYVSNGADLVVPADLPAEISDRVRETARRCFVELGCEGLARVDFFVTDHDIVVNEVNTMPGFTPISLYPRMWDASGVSYRELVDSLVREALTRPTGLR